MKTPPELDKIADAVLEAKKTRGPAGAGGINTPAVDTAAVDTPAVNIPAADSASVDTAAVDTAAVDTATLGARPLPKAPPADMLRHLMEKNQVSAADLADILPKSRVSDILSGRRAISKEQAKGLAKRFSVPLEFFV